MSLNRFLIGTTLGVIAGATAVYKLQERYSGEINQFADDLSDSMVKLIQKNEQLKSNADRVNHYIENVAKPVFNDLQQEIKDYQYQIKPRIAAINEKATDLQNNLEK